MRAERAYEFVDAIKHKGYLAAHAGEFPFPLDGSHWSRLVAAGISQERRQDLPHNVPDFWEWLHADQGPLKRQRKNFKRALHHWFLVGDDAYGLPWWYLNGQETEQQLAWNTLYNMAKQSVKKDLVEIESDWVDGRNGSKVFVPREGQFWVGADSEAWGARADDRIKRGISVMESREPGLPRNGIVPSIKADSPAVSLTQQEKGVIVLPATIPIVTTKMSA
jgi:hypothetical protein